MSKKSSSSQHVASVRYALRAKLMVTLAFFSVIVLLCIGWITSVTITELEERLIAERLNADINYIQDLISHDETAHWNIKGKFICYGDVAIGDGTEANANFAPFLEHERKTGTFAYIFKLDKGAELEYVEATETSAGYHEGHYLRIAGSTKSPTGASIVGTYISKNVADALDTYGVYSGEANVAGGMIFCLYRALLDSEGNIVGAVVVGRNITDLKTQISGAVNRIFTIMFIVIVSAYVLLFFSLGKWLNNITSIVSYIKQIENGNIPGKPLVLDTEDEMTRIAESINKMVESIQENIDLRKKSETDALTGLPNRFAYDRYAKCLYHKLCEEPMTLAVEILDVDCFKQYNDNYGHQAGDKCIIAIAREIYQLASSNENIFSCRYGGDEFLILYHGYSRAEIEGFAAHLKERILARGILHEYSDVANIVTITQGICHDEFAEENTINEFFVRADYALYEVKNVGRNDYRIVGLTED